MANQIAFDGQESFIAAMMAPADERSAVAEARGVAGGDGPMVDDDFAAASAGHDGGGPLAMSAAGEGFDSSSEIARRLGASAVSGTTEASGEARHGRGGGGGDDDASTNVWQRRLANCMFLLIGIGVAMAWTALRAGIAYFSGRFPLGSGFYTVMIAAYNVPCLPLLIAQSAWDAKFDDRYGSARAYNLRMLVSMIVMALCLATVPFGSQGTALVAVVAVGVFDSIAYGTASQFFALFPQATSGYYFIGSSLTSLLSIALTFATGFGAESPTLEAAVTMYAVSAVIVLVGLAAAIVLLRSRIGQHYLAAKDAASRRRVASERAGLEDALLDRDGGGGEAAAGEASTSNWTLLRLTWVCHVALFVCWWTTNWVDSLIAYVPSAGDTPSGANKTFRLVVLYCSLLGELGGKQLNIVRRGRILTTPRRLLLAVVIRFALLVLPFLLYVLQPRYAPGGVYHWRNDAAYGAFQVIFDASGSYLSSLTYAMAPALLTAPSQRAQSSTLLAITLMLGVFAGLGCSFALTPTLNAIPASATG